MMSATATAPRYFAKWTREEETFLIAAKRERFGEKAIAHLLGRTPNAVGEKVKRLRDSGVLLCHREEEIDLLERLLEEARLPEIHAEEDE